MRCPNAINLLARPRKLEAGESACWISAGDARSATGRGEILQVDFWQVTTLGELEMCTPPFPFRAFIQRWGQQDG